MEKIAICVLAHKNQRQLFRLLQAIDDERFDFFVHIDSKSTITPPLTLNLEHSQVFYTSRVNTFIFDYSLIQATCSCLEEAQLHGAYKYFILISGQDYPIKSNDFIYNTLMANYPMNWIDSYEVNDALAHGIMWVDTIKKRYIAQSIKRYFMSTLGSKTYYSPRRGLLFRGIVDWYSTLRTILGFPISKKLGKLNYSYSAGSHFWMLPDISVNHILSVYHKDKKLTRIFKHVRSPEESYFQTVLSSLPNAQIPYPYNQYESPLQEMDNPALRLIKWFDGDKQLICHPGAWGVQDFPIIANAAALFARKFEEDDEVLDLIDKQLR
jgi:hypothetical protein